MQCKPQMTYEPNDIWKFFLVIFGCPGNSVQLVDAKLDSCLTKKPVVCSFSVKEVFVLDILLCFLHNIKVGWSEV